MKITAEQAVARLMARKPTGMRKSRSLSEPTLLRTVKDGGEARVYVFDDDGTGVVSPADDSLPAVLGNLAMPTDEEWDGKFPPEVTWWLLEYAKEIATLDEESEESEPAKAPKRSLAKSNETIHIGPLLGDIKWGQKAPWWNNLKFPHPDPSKNTKVYCVTGCAPLAIGQVLYYHAKKVGRLGCKATQEYTTETYKYSVSSKPAMEMFDWNNMTDGAPTTTSGKKAVAVLMEYCGRSVRANYGYSETSTHKSAIAPALKNYFGMGDARQLQNLSNAELKETVIAELKKGNPVIMCGGPQGACHCFICDGYDSETDMFHFNWGWRGDYDGWFMLTALNPDTWNFTTYKEVFVGLNQFILGDVNMDGYINMTDVSRAIYYSTRATWKIADCNRYSGLCVRAVRTSGAEATDDAIDLNLPSGTLWATCNVGASSPEEIGGRYAWGETTEKKGKSAYSESRYAYYKDGKYTDIGNNISGTKYDVAKKQMGSGWQMPTKEQWEELLTYCNVIIQRTNGVYRAEVKRNKKILTLPLGGCIYYGTYPTGYDADYPESEKGSNYIGVYSIGNYWSSNLYTDSNKKMAYGVIVRKHQISGNYQNEDTRADVNYDGIVDDNDTQLITDKILGKNVL